MAQTVQNVTLSLTLPITCHICLGKVMGAARRPGGGPIARRSRARPGAGRGWGVRRWVPGKADLLSSAAAGGRSWGGAGATRIGGLGWRPWPGPGRPAAASAGLRRAGQRLGAAASILCSRCCVQRPRQVPRSLVRVPGSPEPPRCGGSGGREAGSILKALPLSYPRLEDGFCHVFQCGKSMVVRAPPPFSPLAV